MEQRLAKVVKEGVGALNAAVLHAHVRPSDLDLFPEFRFK